MEGGISPKYVLDEMEQYEINPLITNIYKREKESWEQTRMICYLIAQTNSSKKIKSTDILTFPWDEEKVNTAVSDEDKERLKKKIETVKKKIYGK